MDSLYIFMNVRLCAKSWKHRDKLDIVLALKKPSLWRSKQSHEEIIMIQWIKCHGTSRMETWREHILPPCVPRRIHEGEITQSSVEFGLEVRRVTVYAKL